MLGNGKLTDSSSSSSSDDDFGVDDDQDTDSESEEIANDPNVIAYCELMVIIKTGTADELQKKLKQLDPATHDIVIILNDLVDDLDNYLLHEAVLRGDLAIVKILCQAGSALDVCNAEDKKPIDLVNPAHEDIKWYLKEQQLLANIYQALDSDNFVIDADLDSLLALPNGAKAKHAPSDLTALDLLFLAVDKNKENEKSALILIDRILAATPNLFKEDQSYGCTLITAAINHELTRLVKAFAKAGANPYIPIDTIDSKLKPASLALEEQAWLANHLIEMQKFLMEVLFADHEERITNLKIAFDRKPAYALAVDSGDKAVKKQILKFHFDELILAIEAFEGNMRVQLGKRLKSIQKQIHEILLDDSPRDKKLSKLLDIADMPDYLEYLNFYVQKSRAQSQADLLVCNEVYQQLSSYTASTNESSNTEAAEVSSTPFAANACDEAVPDYSVVNVAENSAYFGCDEPKYT